MNTPLNGDEAVRQWNPTWRMDHIPVWFKKAIREKAIREDDWEPSVSNTWEFLPSKIFDHVGSIFHLNEESPRKKVWEFVAMPYNRDDAFAQSFADSINCEVTCSPVGPWHPKTSLYVFKEKTPDFVEKNAMIAEIQDSNRELVCANQSPGLYSEKRAFEIVIPDPDARPSMRTIARWRANRLYPFVKIGAKVLVDPIALRKALDDNFTVE